MVKKDEDYPRSRKPTALLQSPACPPVLRYLPLHLAGLRKAHQGKHKDQLVIYGVA
jgi:hypothetical protein